MKITDIIREAFQDLDRTVKEAKARSPSADPDIKLPRTIVDYIQKNAVRFAQMQHGTANVPIFWAYDKATPSLLYIDPEEQQEIKAALQLPARLSESDHDDFEWSPSKNQVIEALTTSLERLDDGVLDDIHDMEQTLKDVMADPDARQEYEHLSKCVESYFKHKRALIPVHDLENPVASQMLLDLILYHRFALWVDTLTEISNRYVWAYTDLQEWRNLLVLADRERVLVLCLMNIVFPYALENLLNPHARRFLTSLTVDFLLKRGTELHLPRLQRMEMSKGRGEMAKEYDDIMDVIARLEPDTPLEEARHAVQYSMMRSFDTDGSMERFNRRFDLKEKIESAGLGHDPVLVPILLRQDPFLMPQVDPRERPETLEDYIDHLARWLSPDFDQSPAGIFRLGVSLIDSFQREITWSDMDGDGEPDSETEKTLETSEHFKKEGRGFSESDQPPKPNGGIVDFSYSLSIHFLDEQSQIRGLLYDFDGVQIYRTMMSAMGERISETTEEYIAGPEAFIWHVGNDFWKSWGGAVRERQAQIEAENIVDLDESPSSTPVTSPDASP